MPAWMTADAINQLRALLGDNPTDKFVFKQTPFPPTDGVSTRFFAGDTLIVDDTFQLFQDGDAPDPMPTVISSAGTFIFDEAPSPGSRLEVSYYYQYFVDGDLASFLTNGALVPGFSGIEDDTMPMGVRPAVIDFAASYAYMKKATEYADSLVAEVGGGFRADQSKSYPNWSKLSSDSWLNGKNKLLLFAQNPLNANAITPAFASVTFRMPIYVPLS